MGIRIEAAQGTPKTKDQIRQEEEQCWNEREQATQGSEDSSAKEQDQVKKS